MNVGRFLFASAISLALGLATAAIAQETATRLPSFLTDHMVLQRDAITRIWGWDHPGTTVQVGLGSQTRSSVADAQGNWSVAFPPRGAGGPFDIQIHGSSNITLSDILFGDVWLCSGQSNMEWTVGASDNAQEEIAAGDHPNIRHCKIHHRPAAAPESDVPSDGWQVASPETVGNFTAAGYFFGRELNAELGVPIGLIGSNWGGTRIEPWTPPAGFRQVAELKEITDKLDQFPEKNKKGDVIHQSPLALYNGMIHPLLPFPIKGAIWYQGEANNGEGMAYFHKMQALIAGWRSAWNHPQLPFYYVQLAPFRYGNPEGLPLLWESQAKALSIPYTGMAVTTDIGNVGDIHPRNKQEVGRRLARWALVQTYGRYVVSSGPLFRDMRASGGKLRLHFDYLGGGLTTRDGQSPSGFEVAGSDGAFVAAQAQIDGDAVNVWAEGVAKPTQVRFAWSQEANPNFVNKAGLPAVPFRSGN